MQEDTEPKTWDRKGTFFVVMWEVEAQECFISFSDSGITYSDKCLTTEQLAM